MNLRDFVGATRKFRLFIAPMFPRLELRLASASARLARIVQHPRVARLWGYWRNSWVARIASPIVREFYWADLSRDRVDWARLPIEAQGVLRATYLASAALCILTPIGFSFGSPPLESATALSGSGAGWIVPFWGIALSIGWGVLLCGAGAANRVALVLASATCLQFLGLAAGAAGRSVWNALPAAVVLESYALAERRRGAAGPRDRWAGLATGLLIGAGCGVALVALTPLARFARGHIILAGSALGVVLGAGAWAWARKGKRVPSFGEAAALVGALAMVLFTQVAARGGLSNLANSTLAFLTPWGGYLWPIYYLLGVGIIFKLLNSSKLLTETTQSLLPKRIVVPAAVATVILGMAGTWLEGIFDASGIHWPEPVWRVAYLAHQATASWIWHKPLNALVALWMRWVFLLDALALGWLLIRRRLDDRAVLSLLFLNLLALGLITEYVAQGQGLLVSQTHTAFTLIPFAIFILWQFNKVGLKLGLKDSRHWPSSARVAIGGALLLFLMLAVQVSVVAREPRLVKEIDLKVLQGVLDVGLPYFLYVWATRQVGELPLPLAQLLGAFCLGAALSAPLAALDKLVLAGGSWSGLKAFLDGRWASLVVSGVLPQRDVLPQPWIAARGALAIAALAILLALFARRLPRDGRRPAALLFSTMALFTGLDSFSRAQVDLPLVPPRWWLLISPARPYQSIDESVVASYLSYALPALALGLAIAWPSGVRWRHWPLGLVAALALHLTVALVWPAQEAYLRSTGVLTTAGLAALGLFLLLVRAARRRIEATGGHLPSASSSPPEPALWAVSPRAFGVVSVLCALSLATLGAFNAWRGRLAPRTVPGLAAPLLVPAHWEAVPNAPAGQFLGPSLSNFRPRLFAYAQPAPESGAEAVLKQVSEIGRANLPEFESLKSESWQAPAPGVMGLDYRFARKVAVNLTAPVAGTTVLVPIAGHEILILTVWATFGDWPDRRWDLVRIAQAASASGR